MNHRVKRTRRRRALTITTALIAAALLGLAPQAIAQANATETGVTPDEERDLELPTEREQIGDVPERTPENERGLEGFAEEVGPATLVIDVLVIAGLIALGVLALVGVAYAASKNDGGTFK